MVVLGWPEEERRKFETRVKALHESADLEDQVVAAFMDWELGAAHTREEECRIRARKAIAAVRLGNAEFCSELWDLIQAAKETAQQLAEAKGWPVRDMKALLYAEKVERLM